MHSLKRKKQQTLEERCDQGCVNEQTKVDTHTLKDWNEQTERWDRSINCTMNLNSDVSKSQI